MTEVSASPSSCSSFNVPAESTPAVPPPTERSNGSATVNQDLPTLQKVHLLPFAEADANLQGSTNRRLEAVAPELRRRRDTREVVNSGDILNHDGLAFAVIKCDPPDPGVLGPDTDYFLEGGPVVMFDRIQFSAWGPNEMASDTLFSEVIQKYFQAEYTPCADVRQMRRTRFFYTSYVFQIGDVHLQVEATEPQGLGIVTCNSEIFASWDDTPDFEKVHIVPFQDTLPRAYDFDVFQDYLKPYLSGHAHKKFQYNELFSWNGVQFKMVACEPSTSVARIGKSTTIYCEGVLPPSMRNLLSPDQLNQVAQLPAGLQMLLLNTERTTRELEEVLTQRRGLFEETITEIERFTWPPKNTNMNSQTQCMVCLGVFAIGDDCRRLPCNHVFHTSCVDEWLRRCTDCPICKANVDRAIRQY